MPLSRFPPPESKTPVNGGRPAGSRAAGSPLGPRTTSMEAARTCWRPGSLAARVLAYVADTPGVSSAELADRFAPVDETQISRAGRRLSDAALVTKNARGRSNQWIATAAGHAVAAALTARLGSPARADGEADAEAAAAARAVVEAGGDARRDAAVELRRMGIVARRAVGPRGAPVRAAPGRLPEPIERQLAGLLDQGPSRVRAAVVRALGEWGGPISARVITDALVAGGGGELDHDLIAALRLIGGAGAARALAAVAGGDRAGPVREYALASLGELISGGGVDATERPPPPHASPRWAGPVAPDRDAAGLMAELAAALDVVALAGDDTHPPRLRERARTTAALARAWARENPGTLALTLAWSADLAPEGLALYAEMDKGDLVVGVVPTVAGAPPPAGRPSPSPPSRDPRRAMSCTSPIGSTSEVDCDCPT